MSASAIRRTLSFGAVFLSVSLAIGDDSPDPAEAPPDLTPDTFTCPEGSEVHHGLEMGGQGAWCEKGGLQHGPIIGWQRGDAGLVVVYQGQQENGSASGPWRRWFVSGKRDADGTYVRGQKDGVWTEWHKSGGLKTQGSYRYHKPRYVGDDDDQRVGIWTDWYESGQKQSETEYRDGKADGRHRFWYPNGQLANQGTNSAKELGYVGAWTAWYEDGTKKEEGAFVKGRKSGMWKSWYPNGKLERQGKLDRGSEDGKWTSWYESGAKQAEGRYKLGDRHGAWTNWYENGKPVIKAEFREGQACGKLKCWDDDGASTSCSGEVADACERTDSGADCPPCWGK